ncbi:lung adenoma susceptibility protein 2 isoform X1 [Latimeria chalumnae]|uniref:lung adenoma susceptibility protein 2 isoform X1 n=1 Tax=Latimeria chalumnae TaxID=7897 RepID=UPI00313D7AD8
MSNLAKKAQVISAESTITSLLASSGSQHSLSSSNSSIKYKDKHYSSATDALEAYIEDFEQSLVSPEVSTGKLFLHTNSVNHSRFSQSLETIKKGIKDRVCAGELEYLRQSLGKGIANDPDLISLTTDDLLTLPPDGSLPITHGSALKSSSRNGTRHSFKDSRKDLGSHFIKLGHHQNMQSPSLHYSTVRFQHDGDTFIPRLKEPLYNSSYREFTRRTFKCGTDSNNSAAFPPGDSSIDECNFKLGSTRNYPRWFTSQKSDLDVSGITSVPDVKYPVWLKEFNLLSNKDGTQTQNTKVHFSSAQPQKKAQTISLPRDLVTSHLGHEEGSDLESVSDAETLMGDEEYIADKSAFLLHAEDTFLETECVQRPETKFLHTDFKRMRDLKEPFKDDQIELLILKAERALESPSLGTAQLARDDFSPLTEDVLNAERSWDNIPVPFKSPVPVFCLEGGDDSKTVKPNLIEDFLQDCLKQENQSTLSGGNHPGPVEALKQMLFNLQTVQQSFSQKQAAKQGDDAKTVRKKSFKPSLKNIVIVELGGIAFQYVCDVWEPVLPTASIHHLKLAL